MFLPFARDSSLTSKGCALMTQDPPPPSFHFWKCQNKPPLALVLVLLPPPSSSSSSPQAFSPAQLRSKAPPPRPNHTVAASRGGGLRGGGVSQSVVRRRRLATAQRVVAFTLRLIGCLVRVCLCGNSRPPRLSYKRFSALPPAPCRLSGISTAAGVAAPAPPLSLSSRACAASAPG